MGRQGQIHVSQAHFHIAEMETLEGEGSGLA